MRSRVVIEHLIGEGHEVEIIASSRAADFLAKRFDGVNRIHGLHIVTEENRVRRGKTVWSNVLEGAGAIPSQIAAYFELVEGFRPEVVISDFESWTYYYGQLHRIPVLSVDNQQIINRCTQPADVLEGHRTEFEVTRAFIKSKLPFCAHYLVTTFFYPEIRKERTSLHPPILRPEILAAKPSRGDHLLVYQTAEGHETLTEVLAATGWECRIYGMRRQITEEQTEGSLRFMPFSETRFIEDLASARAVIAGGGFTTMSECVYLHKPMLSVPIRGQFEQVLNARWLERLGYGHACDEIDAAGVRRFLEAVPRCEEALASYSQDGNRDLLAALDQHLDRAAAGVY